MREDAEELEEEIDLVFEEEELEEGAKPDFLDLDKDGDKEEPMKDAAEESLDEEIDLVFEDEEKEEDEPSGEAGSSRRDRMRDRHSKKAARALEEIDLDEEMVREIVEELVVDIAPTKSGWAGTPESVVRYQEEQELARLQGTEAKEENDALVAAAKELSEAKKVVETENEKLKQLIYDLDGQLKESILSNAKLLYTNQTLTSASLNERQKNKIVESIQDADSVEEAKVIYETLQSAAGPSIKKTPKSLSEAISRPSLNMPRRRRENSRGESVVKNRFQKLAGIKNK